MPKSKSPPALPKKGNEGAVLALGAAAVGIGAYVLLKGKGAPAFTLGDTVTLKSIGFGYTGAAGSLYVCWGLKSGPFNEGAGLVAGAFGVAGPIAVIDSPTYRDYAPDPAQLATKPTLFLDPHVFQAGTFDTYVWLSTKPTAKTVDMVQNETGQPVLVTDIGAIKIS
ncbi:MAG: hypothetical protein Q8N51_08120 [Gammaproteobacteria bacterium]|nr:hypothetical protein [Gammaproteobacteria bacterium]